MKKQIKRIQVTTLEHLHLTYLKSMKRGFQIDNNALYVQFRKTRREALYLSRL